LLVHPGPWRSPQIEIKDLLELLGGYQRHEFPTVFEPTALNDAVKEFGLEARDNAVEVRCIENPGEHGTAVIPLLGRGTLGVRHGIVAL
jgi:hypothetical protein